MKLIRYLAFGLLITATASSLKAQNTAPSADAKNYSACVNGYYSCDPRQLTESEQAAVAEAAHKRNYSDCLHCYYSCNLRQLTESERPAVAEAAHKRNYSDCLHGYYSCNLRQRAESEQAAVASGKQETPTVGVVTPAGQNTPTTGTAHCAENGSCYGDLNANGVPKTVHVNGYYRKDGTYVRDYYRSAPGTNPPKASK